jgi:hypothetical protein
MINDPSDQQDGISSCDAAGMRNHVSLQHKVLNPDAIWITQNVVKDFLLQHGYGDLFAAEPNGLTSNTDKKEAYHAALATSLDDETGHRKASKTGATVFKHGSNEASSVHDTDKQALISQLENRTPQSRLETSRSSRPVDLTNRNAGPVAEISSVRFADPTADIENRLEQLIARNRGRRAAANARAHADELPSTENG